MNTSANPQLPLSSQNSHGVHYANDSATRQGQYYNNYGNRQENSLFSEESQTSNLLSNDYSYHSPVKTEYKLLKIKPCSPEETSDLDKGCFRIYTIWLVITMGCLIVMAGVILFNIFKDFHPIKVLELLVCFFLFYFVHEEYEAITEKDLEKAVSAINGFKVFMVIYLVFSIIFGIVYIGNNTKYFVGFIVGIGVFYLSTFYGAYEVVQRLSKEGHLLKYDF